MKVIFGPTDGMARRPIVRDDKGAELPLKGPGDGSQGGMGTLGDLVPGQSYNTLLDFGGYVEFQRPGKYSLEVLFHSNEWIADEEDLSGLIIFRAKPITLIVRPLVIELTAAERKQAAKWFSAIDTNKPVNHVMGKYGAWAYSQVPLDSPQGQLLNMGVKAIPVLMESLDDKSISAEKRAWILSLLFGVTGQNDPDDLKHYALGAPRPNPKYGGRRLIARTSSG